jgi:inositol-phosphate phosphatase/L-galactose 1-phosphate phosphatase
MSDIDYDACLLAAECAAWAAGDEIKSAWDAERDVEYKGTVDLVTGDG